MKFKSVAFLLACLMIFQMFTFVSANAYESDDTPAIRLMIALDIMEKDEYADKFWKDIPVTRAEMAKILCKLYGFEVKPDSSPKFTDVDDDYRGYVETVARNGYMSGIGENKFGSQEYITRMQLAKIYVTMLDGDGFANTIGGYPDGYMTVARRLGLSPSYTGGNNVVATQNDVAEMIYKAMHSEVLQFEGISGDATSYETVEGQTFLTEKLDIYKHVAILRADGEMSIGTGNSVEEGKVKVGNDIYNDPKGLCDGLIGCEVVIYERKSDADIFGEIIYVEPSTKNNIIEIDKNSFKNASGSTIDYRVENSTRHIKLGYAVTMFYNGRSIDFDINEISDDKEEMKFIDNNGDNLYDVVVLYDYSDYMIDSINVENEKIFLKYGEKTIVLEDQIKRIYRNDERVGIEELKSSDIISVAISRGTDSKVYTIKSCQNTLSGKVDSYYTDSDNKMYVDINDKDYRIADYYTSLVNKGKIQQIEPGDSGTFYLNVMNEIVASNLAESSTGVAYLADWGVEKELGKSRLGILLFTQNGDLEVYMSGEKLVFDGKSMKINDILDNPDCIAKLDSRVLVKYTMDEKNIKGIEFPVTGYSATQFSADVNADLSTVLECTRTSILDDKWKMTGDTIVFRVPKIEDMTAPGISDKALDRGQYSILGSPFVSYENTAKAALYDINPDNTIGYALWPRISAPSVSYNSPLVMVSWSGMKLDKESDDYLPCINGYRESGSQIELCFSPDINIATMPKEGDVIQYTLDYYGHIDSYKITNSVDIDIDSYGISELISSMAFKVLGEVAYVTDSHVSVYFGSYTGGDISPDEIGTLVNSVSAGVYLYDSSEDSVYPIEFSEIEKGDKIFAAISTSNTTRMLVVYR